jgi:Fe-S cluster assembly protein SufD
MQVTAQQHRSDLLSLLQLRPAAPEGAEAIRERADDRLQGQTLPTTRDEDWRFTDLSPLRAIELQTPAAVDVLDSTVADSILPETQTSHLVFVNGGYAPHLSNVTGLPAGVFAGNLAQFPAEKRDRLESYLAQQPGGEEVFTALNTASFGDVAIVWVPQGKIVEMPVQLLFVSALGTMPTASSPRCLIVAERNSSLVIVEQYASTSPGCPDRNRDGAYFTNAVTEICLEDNAQVEQIRLQREGEAAIHISKTAITQSKDSRYTCHDITFGAQLSRRNLEVFQRGEGTETTLNGLTLIRGEQLADTHSTVALTCPNGTANQLHKCIVDGKGHAIFNGRVCVPKAAQLTNASQLNRNLLLSPHARVNTKPQLEIVADNVKCAHGATVSQLEDDEVFYLQSRGLNRKASEYLLLDAFAGEILQKLPIASLQMSLSRCVSCHTHI